MLSEQWLNNDDDANEQMQKHTKDQGSREGNEGYQKSTIKWDEIWDLVIDW